MEPVTAQCILRGPGGGSVVEADEPPDADALERLRPTPAAFADAADRLARLGFEVGERGAATLTVSGERNMFERVFATRLEWREEPGGGGPAWQPASPPVVPEELADLVAGLVFPIVPIPLR